MQLYISSTFADLEPHRAAAAAVLRRMGHRVIGMEDYVAADERPLERCLKDVARPDAYIGIFAWRYGYRPPVKRGRAKLSITEYEYREAVRTDTPRLIFVLRPDAPWPGALFDAVVGEKKDATAVVSLREKLTTERLVSFFSTPDELAGLVGPAVYRQEATMDMVSRILQSGEVAASLVPQFTSTDPLHDTRLHTIADTIDQADDSQVAEIALGSGKTWWSTRLYVFADLSSDLTGIRQLVFTGPNGAYLGMATPDIVRDRLRTAEPALAAYHADVGVVPEESISSVPDEVHRRFDRWLGFMDARGGEESQKVWMRSDVLKRRLGDYLIQGSIKVDMELGLTPTQMQQILDWPWPHVPITPVAPAGSAPGTTAETPSIVVVDRDAFALRAAREYVSRQLRSGN